MSNTEKKKSITDRAIDWVKEMIYYAEEGVWREPRNTLKIRCVKVISLSVRTFMSRDLQVRAMAMTYTTVLAIVPALALLFAIAQGFGFQNILHDQLMQYFPSQQKALSAALGFVDSYLKAASQGVFVGVGIVFLLWTLISLFSSMEDAFNNIWGIKQSRSLYRKITDYLTALILIPILLVCSSSVSIFISGLDSALGLDVLTPFVNIALDLSPWILTWLAFTLTLFLMPNTKVQFKYAALAGFLCMIGFQIVQYLFLSGQIYVSKYNAIYGSFAFLPLMLVWLQLSWLIILFGCLMTYSLQNVSGFNFLGSTEDVSKTYMQKLSFVVCSILIQRQRIGLPPQSIPELSAEYKLPVSLVNVIIDTMYDCGIVYKIQVPNSHDLAVVPAVDINTFTAAEFFNMMSNHGKKDFIPMFGNLFAKSLKTFVRMKQGCRAIENDILFKDIEIPTIGEIEEIAVSYEQEKK